MEMDLSPKSQKLMFDGEGGSYYSWSSSEIPLLGEAKVGAGVFVLKPGGLALPHYADCSKVGYVIQGELGVAGLVSPHGDQTEEIVLGLRTGDVIPVPSGWTSWWYNHGNSSDVIIAFVGETAQAYVPGQFTYFFLVGAGGILGGFSTEFISRAYSITENEAEILAKSQTGALIVKLSPEERKTIPQPHQNSTVNKWVKNSTRKLADIHVEKAGTITSFTGKSFPFLDEIGLSCSIVKLEADAMLSPVYTADFSVRVFYAAKGSGKVQIVGLNSKLVLDSKIVAGEILVVPRFFTVAVVAGGEGMECFSIRTTSRPADGVDFASKQSVFNALPPSLLQSALNVPQEFAKFIKGQMAKSDVLIPPRN